MRLRIFVSILMIVVGQQQVSAATLQGEWKLIEMIYQGKPMPLPNPDLNLRWTFFANGTERLYWDRGTEEFCERWAHFKVQEGNLIQEVFAVNPRNAVECHKDPDMQVGRKTSTPVSIQQNKILLRFPLGDEELIYVLKEVI